MKRIIVGLVFLSLILLPMLSEATDVGGIIYENTTWNLAGSPYNMLDRVQVAEGVTLTIEPGVVVNGNEHYFEVWGYLNAIGTNTSHITLNSIQTEPRTSNTVINIQFAEINSGYFYFCSSNDSFTLKDSKITNSDFIHIISTCSNTSFIERNILIGVGEITIGHPGGNVQIRNNVFYNQTDSLKVFGNEPVVEYNSFLSTDRIALRLSNSTSNFSAINNFWNTTNTSVIDSMIIDRNDELSIPYYVEYIPFLTAPHPDTPLPNFNQVPIADAGSDQVVFNSVNFNGSGSSDPDGSIASYDWSLQYRGNASYNKTASGATPTVSDLQPGFYDVYLTVTDNLGAKATDGMLLAVSGQCTGWPSPNANLDVDTFRITNNKKKDSTTVKMDGIVDLPELSLVGGDTVNARITLELFGVLAGGDDLIMSEDVILNVIETKNKLDIRK